MEGSTLPQIWKVKEVADYLKVDEKIVLLELESGNLRGFKVGQEWRFSDSDLLAYINRPITGAGAERREFPETALQNTDWSIIETGAFDFRWPKKGGGGYPEHYDKGYDATKIVDGRHYTFRVGFGIREAAGKTRRRVTIWLGNRAVVEFAGSNDFDKDGLLAGIIRLREGGQLSPYQKIPDEYKSFKVDRYSSIVQGPHASKNMAVVVHKDELKSMLAHALIRATWKELL